MCAARQSLASSFSIRSLLWHTRSDAVDTGGSGRGEEGAHEHDDRRERRSKQATKRTHEGPSCASTHPHIDRQDSGVLQRYSCRTRGGIIGYDRVQSNDVRWPLERRVPAARGKKHRAALGGQASPAPAVCTLHRTHLSGFLSEPRVAPGRSLCCQTSQRAGVCGLETRPALHWRPDLGPSALRSSAPASHALAGRSHRIVRFPPARRFASGAPTATEDPTPPCPLPGFASDSLDSHKPQPAMSAMSDVEPTAVPAAPTAPAAPAAPAPPALYSPPSYRYLGLAHPAVPRPLAAVKFSPDGRWLATGSADATLRVYRVCNEGVPIPAPAPVPVPSADPAVAVAVPAGNGSTAPAAPAPAPVTPPPLVSPQPSVLLYAELLAAHELGINDLAFTPDSSYILTASDDKLIHAWDLRAASKHADTKPSLSSTALVSVPCIKTFKGHSSYVFCLAISHAGNMVASGGYDESLRLWDLKSGKVLRTIRAHSDPISAVDFNRDGSVVVTSSYDGLCRVWETSTGRCLKTIYQDSTPPVSHVRFSPNGKFVLVSTLDSTLRLWELTRRDQCIKAYGGWKRGEGAVVVEASASQGGENEEKTSSASTTVSVVAPSASASSLGDYVNTSLCIGASFITLHSRQLIVAGSEDGSIVLWDVIKQARVDTWVPPRAAEKGVGADAQTKRGPVLCVTGHPTLPILASASMDAPFGVTLWAHQQQ